MNRNRRFPNMLFVGIFLMVAAIQPTWKPYPGQQTNFLSTPAFEAFFGGAAYPGKTECLLMEALRQIAHPRYNGILFRRTYPQLEGADGLIARSQLWYPAYGGKYNEAKHVWKFPSGARIYFGHLQHEDDIYNYQGWQLAFVGFDELPQFTETQYLYLFSRCRVELGSRMRAYVRTAGNPGGIGHYWVKKRFVTRGIANKIGYFTRINDVDTAVTSDYPKAKSRTFIPASWRDNPKTSPEYLANLAQMDEVTRARLEDGDWDAEDNSVRVYPNWSSTLNVTDEAEYKPGVAIRWGVDDGYAEGEGVGTASHHPRVFLLAQVTPIGGLDIFAEYYKTQESDYMLSINNVLEMGYPAPEIAYVDSSAAMFRANIWQKNIQATGATHHVDEGIKNLRRMICDGNGVRLIRVHPRCQNLIREMSVYSKDKRARFDSGEAKPLKVDDHGPDALRYLAWSLRYGR